MSKCFSGTLYKENLKRFWTLSALGLVFFYLSGILMLSLSHVRYNYYDVENMLQNQNLGFVFIECALPVAIVAALFSYLNKANSVNLIHSLPYSRRELYITNYLSGVTLFAIPEVLTALMLIAYKKPTYYEQAIAGTAGFDPSTAVDIFTVPNILYWLAIALVVSLFVFSVCIIGAMVCGNGVISFLTGCAFNVLVPAVILLCIGYASTSYFGYDGGDIFETVIQNYHPAICLSMGNTTPIEILLFLAIAIVVAVLGYMLYNNRKLERCGDSYVFAWAKHLIGFLFVFICSIIVGLIFFEGMGAAAYILGGLIGFIIGQMISRKTFRIVNAEGIKNFVIYTVGMLVIIGLIRIDVIGYQKRVPKLENIEYVEVGNSYLDPTSSWATITFTDENNIREAIALHQDIVDNKKELNELQDDEPHCSVGIRYTLKNGKRLSRSYWINEDFVAANNHIYNLSQSEEVLNRIVNITKLESKDLNISVELIDKFLNLPEFYLYNSFEIVDEDKNPNGSSIKLGNEEVIIDTADSFRLYGKDEFWKGYCEDLLIRSNKPAKTPTQLAYMYINFEKHFDSPKDANLFAASLYDGAGYHEETKGNYYFYLNLPIFSDMENSVNWLEKNLIELNLKDGVTHAY